MGAPLAAQHLDLEACVWLEETLKNYPSVLLLVSHSQDFLNGVCNSIIFMGKKQLTYYSGALRHARHARARGTGPGAVRE